MLAFVSIESLVPDSHPFRKVKPLAARILRELDPLFDKMYAKVGRPSVPPERLLKSMVLMALFSVRSDLTRAQAPAEPPTGRDGRLQGLRRLSAPKARDPRPVRPLATMQHVLPG